VRVMCRHLDLMIEVFGEEPGCRMFRKVAPWYARRFGPAKPFKRQIISIESRADFEAALADYLSWRAQFCDDRGELLPPYRPAPMTASFMGDTAPVEGPQEIPVPGGPVELW